MSSAKTDAGNSIGEEALADAPQLSIVVVNYCTWDSLDKGLASLSTEETSRYKVVVVDNRSEVDRCAEFRKRFPAVRFLRNEGNLGFAHGCNFGAAATRGDLLLFLNPDVVATPAQIDALLAARERNPGFAILTTAQVDSRGRAQKVSDVFPGTVSNLPLGKKLLRFLEPSSAAGASASGAAVKCDWVSGSVLLISRDAYSSLGGWNDRYWMYSEDIDLCYRARRHGLQVGYLPQIELLHHRGLATHRDERTRVLTKSHVIVSKHLFYHLNYRGLRAVSAHLTEAAKRCLPLVVGSVLNVLTLKRVRGLRVRAGVLRRVTPHYWGWLRLGSPPSSHPRHQPR